MALHTLTRWALAFSTMATRHVEIGALVDVDVAEPLVVLEDGHRRPLRDQPHELLAPPRNDEVEVAIEREHRHDGGAVGRVDVLDGVGGQARLLDRLGEDLRDDRVGLERLAASAQQHRVAGLEAEPGGVRGDVGAGLVDEADDAERDANPRDLDAARPPPDLDGLADGVGQARRRAGGRPPSPRSAPR